MWKCGNVEICLPCLHLVTMEVWKCGNMSSMSLSNNSGSVEMWKCAKSFKILTEAHPRAYLVANRIFWKPNPQQSHSVQKGRPFSSRTNNYKNMRPGGELKQAMSPSCDWQQSEVTPVISSCASPIFNSQIIPDVFPDFHTFRVIRLKETRHISRFPHFQS